MSDTYDVYADTVIANLAAIDPEAPNLVDLATALRGARNIKTQHRPATLLLHAGREEGPEEREVCFACGTPWPCATPYGRPAIKTPS